MPECARCADIEAGDQREYYLGSDLCDECRDELHEAVIAEVADGE